MHTESAAVAIVQQHRSAFRYGVQDFADTEPEQPMPAECCSEIGADSEDGGMEMLAGLSLIASAFGVIGFAVLLALG